MKVGLLLLLDRRHEEQPEAAEVFEEAIEMVGTSLSSIS